MTCHPERSRGTCCSVVLRPASREIPALLLRCPSERPSGPRNPLLGRAPLFSRATKARLPITPRPALSERSESNGGATPDCTHPATRAGLLPEHWRWSSFRSYFYGEPGLVRMNDTDILVMKVRSRAA